MRYAIFSDVHANLRAWDQVLDDIRGQAPDALVCLGDAVGYGPKPEEVLRGIREVTSNFVMGNHDAAAAGEMDYSIFNAQARHSIDWTTKALSADSRKFLGGVPLAIDSEDIHFVHAEISDPGRFGYIDDLDKAKSNFAASDHFVTFVGHTHFPNIYQLSEGGSVIELPDENRQLDASNRYIVNVGSVGEPRNFDDLRGVYVIYDSESRKVEFRRVEFDIAAYRRDLESTALEVKPFFLQSYEFKMSETQVAMPSAAVALAMEAPAASTASIARPGGPVQLRTRPQPGYARRAKGGGMLVTLTLIGVFLAIGLVIWLSGKTSHDDRLAGGDSGKETEKQTRPTLRRELAPSPQGGDAGVSEAPPIVDLAANVPALEPDDPPPPPEAVEPDPSPKPVPAENWPETLLLVENFENPNVTGYRAGSVPERWIGSELGQGGGKRGLIDKGKEAQFSTADGRQGFVLVGENSGLTSSRSMVREKLEAGHLYKLTFNVGVNKGGAATYHAELVAFDQGHDDVARRDVSPIRPGALLGEATGEASANDLSQTVAIEFMPDAANPNLGKTIGVRLLKAEGSAIYDKLRLVVRKAPPDPEVVTASSSRPVPNTPPEVPEPPPAKPPPLKRVENPTVVAWWRMEADSVGDMLVDAVGKNSLMTMAPGNKIRGLAPEEIPSNGVENNAALGIGVWGESEPAGEFALTPNRSFTIEGWVATAKPRGAIFLAGTRSGDANDKQGWHIDIRPKGQMCFFYDNGPGAVQALSERLKVGDLKPHHFAAVWDHDKADGAGRMRLYFDGELVGATEVPHAKIPKKQVNPFRIGASSNPPKIGLDEVRFAHAALSPLEFLRAEAQSMIKKGDWSDGANWSSGEPPSGTTGAIVGAGISAEVKKVPDKFSGDLALAEGARLTVPNFEAFEAVVPESPSKLVMYAGARFIITAGAGKRGGESKFGPIELAGDAKVWGGRSTVGHHTKRSFSGEVTGTGTLTLDGVNNNEFVFRTDNPFDGGLIAQSTQKQGFRVRGKVAGSLGKGDVEIRAHATLRLQGENAIDRGATLTLSGTKDSRSASKVIIDESNTVTKLIFDDEEQKAGTWGGEGSGAENEHEKFSGKGVLTVDR